MGILLDTAWIISEVERFWFCAEKIREYAQWHSDKTAKTGFVIFGGIDVGAIWVLGTHVAGYKLFNPGRHLVRAEHYRDLRVSALSEWSEEVA
ncbi:MAG: hypothetical protein V7700_16590 [Halioglobus sp.]